MPDALRNLAMTGSNAAPPANRTGIDLIPGPRLDWRVPILAIPFPLLLIPLLLNARRMALKWNEEQLLISVP